MKRRQLKWVILALISGMTIPFLMLTGFHGASMPLISIVSLLSFTFSAFMFGMTKDHTIKELIATFISSLNFEGRNNMIVNETTARGTCVVVKNLGSAEFMMQINKEYSVVYFDDLYLSGSRIVLNKNISYEE